MRPWLPFLLPLPFALLAAITCGCNTAHVSGTPDAAHCDAVPESPCKAEPPSPSGCTGKPFNPQGDLPSLIPTDASFPVGCRVFVQDPTPDEQNQCIIEGSCQCDVQDGGAIDWTCTESHQ